MLLWSVVEQKLNIMDLGIEGDSFFIFKMCCFLYVGIVYISFINVFIPKVKFARYNE